MKTEEIAFQIISGVGAAKSKYMEALELAKHKKIEEAKCSMEEGKQFFLEGHKAHAKLLSASVGADTVDMNLLLAHAEDQLMSTEIIEIMVSEWIHFYETMK